MTDLILIKDLPEQLVRSVIQDLATYTVAFLSVTESAKPYEAELIGTGVLVSAGGRRAILTADHVAEVLPNNGRIGLFLDRTSQSHTIDAAGVSKVRVGRGTNERDGPDLAVLLLAPQIAGALAAKKSFFNLDSVREVALTAEPDLRDGAWFAQGFLEERGVVKAEPGVDGLTKYFYNFTGVGGPHQIDREGGFDYLDMMVAKEARNGVPVHWGGMSGGGIWRVPLKKDATGTTHLRPVLSGIMYYQHPTTPTSCGVRGHALQSIYDRAYRKMVEP